MSADYREGDVPASPPEQTAAPEPATKGLGNAGKVYFWEHEAEAPAGESPGFDNMYFVADNFLSFLTSLTELE